MSQPPVSEPTPAYESPTSRSTLYPSPTFLSALQSSPRRLLSTHTVPPRSGYAWHVQAGQLVRVTTPEGPQVGDLNLWSATNPRERFWAARTRQLHQSHVSVGDRLWSCLPYMRPMVAITGDSLKGYGVDGVGGRCHDLLGTRCDPYINKMLSDTSFDFHCHSSLTRAILPFGLAESDVHDVLNVFQVTGLNKDGKYWMGTCPAKPGDFFEFFAEIDLLCALSTCPGGDLSNFGWGTTDEEMKQTCRPLGVEVYELEDPKILGSWTPPKPSNYAGMHGLKSPISGM
ncbi:hypothetical protein MMC10_007734 [Thelotrema lepadinum]|nr:hypothetical protein [Thelotrema lepadinum]